MEKEEREEEERKRLETQEKIKEAKRKEEEAKNRVGRPLEDSEVVDEIFDFLGDKDTDKSSKQ